MTSAELLSRNSFNALANGAPSPFKARFTTVSKQAAPVITTNNRPISIGTGSTQPDHP